MGCRAGSCVYTGLAGRFGPAQPKSFLAVSMNIWWSMSGPSGEVSCGWTYTPAELEAIRGLFELTFVTYDFTS